MERYKNYAVPLIALLGGMWGALLWGWFGNGGHFVYADDLRITPVVSAVQKVSPAVVNISTEEIIHSHPFMSLDPFADDFFRDFFDINPPRRSRQSLGSGVIIDAQGLVVTNEHVIARATNIVVTLADHREFTAKVIGADPDFDIAVLKLETTEHLPSISFGTSSDLMPGETVIAIGNPFGLSHTVTTGVISAVHRSIKTEKRIYEDFIQTDAAINPGNSGGPLINIKGELVGINTAIYREGQGIGFAIPVDKVHRIVVELLEYGEVRPAYLGITVENLTPELGKSVSYRGHKGVLITGVDKGSPAEGKLLRGDVLLEMNGKVVGDQKQYVALVKGLLAGERVECKIHRGGRVFSLPLVAGEFPLWRVPDLCWELLGIAVEDYQGRGVVVTRVNPNSPANYLGMRQGDVIYQLGDRETNNLRQFAEALIRHRHASSLFMVVGRGRYAYRVVVPLS